MAQYEKAIADYEQALKMNPNDVDTPQRLLYAKSQLAQRNAPPPAPTVAATPTPTPKSAINPMTIGIGLLVVIAIVIIGIMAARRRPLPVDENSRRIR